MSRTNILLVGLDGANPDLMRRLAEQGEMPFLRACSEQKPLRPLESIPPYATPSAWNSIYTGVTPAWHGVLDFVDLTAPRRQLTNSHSLRSAPFWKRLSDHAQRVAMIGFPFTYPPLPVNGVMVSGLPAPHQGAVWSFPPEFDAHLKAIPHFLPDPEMTSPRVNPERSISRLERHVQAVTEAALAAHRTYGEAGWSLFGVHFQALDTFQHMFWAWIDPTDRRFYRRPERERRSALRFLRVLDDSLRRLTEALRPEGIVILSDHGFGPAYEAVCPNYCLLDQGLLTLASPARLQRSLKLQSMLKRLDFFNLRSRVKISAGGGAVLQGLDHLMREDLIDHDRTPAVVRSGGYCGLMSVKPGFEAAARDALLQARHPMRGERLIRSVSFITELWDGPGVEIWREYAVVQPEEGYLIDSHFRHYGLVAPVSAGLTGTHRPTGLLWTTVSALEQARNILDIAPGLLSALGLSLSPSPDQGADKPTGQVFAPQDEKAIEDRLRQLGYL